jgi:DNA-binding CsgD family transcriptional regulator
LQIWEEPPAVAKADAKGCLDNSGERFIELLLTEWPTWQNAHLPPPLAERLQQNSQGIYLGKKITIRFQRRGDFYELLGRKLGQLAALSERERWIALMFADGLKPIEIAAKLHIEYATVRIHLGNVYRKLDVNDATG